MKLIDPVLMVVYCLTTGMILAGVVFMNWFALTLQRLSPDPQALDGLRVFGVLLWTLAATICTLPALRSIRRQLLGHAHE